MSTEIATVEAEILAEIKVTREPSLVLEEARKAAVALKDVMDKKPQKFMIGDEQYLEFEDWQTIGKFYGVTCCEEGEPQYVELAGLHGFKANSVALHSGNTISRATAFCLSDEEKWGERNKYAWAYCLKSGGTSVEDPGPTELIWIPNPNKPGRSVPKKERILVGKEKVPLFQLASMAQTRANAKALRNVLSWVVVLAGYKPTPAEELNIEPQIKQIEGAAHAEAAQPQSATATPSFIHPLAAAQQLGTRQEKDGPDSTDGVGPNKAPVDRLPASQDASPAPLPNSALYDYSTLIRDSITQQEVNTYLVEGKKVLDKTEMQVLQKVADERLRQMRGKR